MSHTSEIRIIGFLRRAPSLTPSDFYHHWEHKHAPLIIPLLLKYGITGYSQIHTPEHFRRLLPGAADFDGAGTMTMESWDVFVRIMSDPYFTDVVAQDEALFLDHDRTTWVVAVGEEKVFIKDGKPAGGEQEQKS